MLLLPIRKEMSGRLRVLLAALTVTVALSVYWQKSQLLAQTGGRRPVWGFFVSSLLTEHWSPITF